MDNGIPYRVAGIVFVSSLLTACCNQPQGIGASGGHASNTGNCHTHKENASKGTTKHCHAHVNGSNHSHTYGRQAKVPIPSADVSPNVRQKRDVVPSHYDGKKKGYYRGSVDDVIDPYAKDVLSSYRN